MIRIAVGLGVALLLTPVAFFAAYDTIDPCQAVANRATVIYERDIPHSLPSEVVTELGRRALRDHIATVELTEGECFTVLWELEKLQFAGS